MEETESSLGERRRHLRAPLIVFKIGSGKERYLFGYAQTIGAGGLFIASINPKPMGERFPIEFALPGIQLPIHCQCEVVWRREYDPSRKEEPGFGVCFLDLAESDREIIEHWVENYLL